MPPKDSMRGYCTHLPALFDSLLKTTGAVIEIGGGYSTAVIAAYCHQYRVLTTVETDQWWFGFLLSSANPWHLVVKEIPAEGLWDVALIDGPAETRQKAIEALRNRAKILVVHDVEHEEGYGYDFSGFDVERWGPMPETAVLKALAAPCGQ